MAKHLETRNQKNILYVFKQNKAHTHTHKTVNVIRTKKEVMHNF